MSTPHESAEALFDRTKLVDRGFGHLPKHVRAFDPTGVVGIDPDEAGTKFAR